MILGRINQRVKELLNKDKFDEIDLKLLKGIFVKSNMQKQPKKGIKETFTPYAMEQSTYRKPRIVRKFKDFVLRDSCDEFVGTTRN